ncbi:MAG: ATP-binding protein [Desulfurococcaceae archaeon]|jgi:dephospho-CoA kinase|nr:ATP-binding protein [Desulfurococcaceae archaeon]
MISNVRRVKLKFTPDLEVEFTDRDRALKQVYELAEKGTASPVVVYGPEGCGKSAWLKQTAEVLREGGFDVIYADVAHRDYVAHTDVREVIERVSEVIADTTGYIPIKLADLVVLLANQLLKKWRKKKIALLVDEVFQAIGLDKAEIYTKMLLNIIEYPPESYENIVIIVATSEGLSRWRVGRHRWAWLMPMWNMSKEGFEELYEKIPNPKPPYEEIWRLTGGNPYVLRSLYINKWSTNILTNIIVEEKRLTPEFISKWRKWLELTVEDPDNLWSPEVPEELINELIARNLIVYFLRDRDPELWIDEPPPERDLEVGVGRYVAWQSSIHREAVKKALEKFKH